MKSGNKFLRSSALLVLSLALNTLAYENNAHAAAPPKSWEPECLSQVNANAPACATTDKQLQNIQNLHAGMLKSPSGQDYIEKEFLAEFLKDQYQQTQCEKQMLAPYDLSPNDGTLCEDDVHVTDMKRTNLIAICKLQHSTSAECAAVGVGPRKKVSQDAQKRQTQILDKIWNDHELLIKESDACDFWTTRLNHKDWWNSAVTAATVWTGVSMMKLADLQGPVEAQKQKEFHCGAKASITNTIWNGNSPQMQTFLKTWTDQFHQHPNLSKEQFMSEALNVGYDHKMQDGDDHLTLESVVAKMTCDAKHRDKVINQAVKVAPNGDITPNPITPGDDVFDALLGDGGQAEGKFIARSAYAGVASPMSCHLLKQYNNEFTHTKTYKYGKIAVETGVVAGSMFIPGVNGVVGAAVASTVFAAYDITMACKNNFKPGTLEVEDVCQQIKGHEKDLNFVASKVDSGDSCVGAIESGALTVAAGAVGGGAVDEAASIKALLEADTVAEKMAVKTVSKAATRDVAEAAGGTTERTLSRASKNLVKDPTQLEAYGLSSDARVTKAVSRLEEQGMPLSSDPTLREQQIQAIRNHLQPEGTEQSAYYDHSLAELKQKVQTGKDVQLTREQTNFLIDNGYAGDSAIAPDAYKKAVRTANMNMDEVIRSRPTTVTIENASGQKEILNAASFEQSSAKEITVNGKKISLQGENKVTIAQGKVEAVFPIKPAPEPQLFSDPRQLESFMAQNPNKSITLELAGGKKVGADFHPAVGDKPAYLTYDAPVYPNKPVTLEERHWKDFKMDFQKNTSLTKPQEVVVNGKPVKQWVPENLANDLKANGSKITIKGPNGQTKNFVGLRAVRPDGTLELFANDAKTSILLVKPEDIVGIDFKDFLQIYGPPATR